MLLGRICPTCSTPKHPRYRRLDCRCEPVYPACDICHAPVYVDEYGEIPSGRGGMVRGHARRCLETEITGTTSAATELPR
jgi:hypothetical protein